MTKKKIEKMKYDKNNIFAKILRKEIPCNKVYENEYVLSFYDISPLKKLHILVIPKGDYIDLDHFNSEASDKEIIEFSKSITYIVKMLKISSYETGYRILSNAGLNGGQEVPHFHYHIFGGEKIGKMVV
jgi:histidine triad (HIT) family protein|tara:strand:+ start:3229 stop:3615 length:387 start_codon:yes stop_codon:yes gene_type:complete